MGFQRGKKTLARSRMIKSFEKLKVRIDQNLNRAEKSEALAEDVVKVENKVACLKQVRKDKNFPIAFFF